MTKQIIIALATEGITDLNFLQSVIKRTFDKVALECLQEVEIFEPVLLKKIPGNIETKALGYANKAIELIKLESLPSYQKFENAVREIFEKLDYF